MHFLAGRAEERLSFDLQREIAVRLGYTAHPGLRDVERFMKHYFLIAKDVGDLTAILCGKLEDSQAKPMPVLSRMMARFRPRTRPTLSESDDFVVDYNRINVVDENVFKHDPVNLIRIFHLAQKYNLAFHPDAMQPRHRDILYVALFLHDIAKGRIEDHSIAGARVARNLCPRLGFSAAETELVAWLIEVHLLMSSVAQSRDLSDRVTIENFSNVMQSVERLKLLTILTTADIKAVGPGVWNGWKAQLIRTLYYETEPVLTGGFSEVNRAERVAAAQAEFRAELGDWTPAEVDAYIALHYPAYWLKVDLPQKVAHARFLRAAAEQGKSLATSVAFSAVRGVTELTVLAPDHPWLLSIIAGACAVAGANIVDAQIFTTTDGRALDTIAVSREFEHDEDEARRAARITDSIEKALRGDLRLPEVVAKRAGSKSRLKAFVVEPEVTVNNAWS